MPCHILSNVDCISASSTLGLALPLAQLERNGEVEHRMVVSGHAVAEDIRWADIVIFQRSAENADLEAFRLAQSLNKLTVYDLDDNLLALPESARDLWVHYNIPHRVQNIKTFLAEADMVKAATPALARELRPYTQNEVIVLPLPNADGLYVPVKHSSDGVVRFVYAASVSNYNQLGTIAGKAIQRIIDEYGGKVHFVFFGGQLPGVEDNTEHVTHVPGLPFEMFIKVFAAVTCDAALATLEDNPFTRCKTNNKFREYAARGLAGIYSNISVYSDCVQHGVTGLLADNNAEAWYQAMRQLIENPEATRSMGLAARAFAESNFTLSRFAGAWRDSVFRPLLSQGGRKRP